MFLKRRLSHLLHLVFFGLAAGALVAMAGPPATSDDEVERYTRLVDDIRDFERFSNARINDLIFAGLHSGNPKVVDLTIAAMHAESMYRSYRNMRSGDLHETLRKAVGKGDRDIVRVPGIRDFLIDYAKDGLAKHGWKAVAPLMDPSMDVPLSDVFDVYHRHIWFSVFGMLTTYFPGDPEVRRLLPENLVDDKDAGDRQRASMVGPFWMGFLNAGLFADEEADDLRLALLADSNPSMAATAARGLAISHSDEGFRTMAQALWRRDEALPAIAAAMATYGAPAAPHLAPLLGPDAGVGELPSHLREPLMRIAAQMGRLADADAAHMAGTLEVGADIMRLEPRAHARQHAHGGVLEVDFDSVLAMLATPVVTNASGEKKMLLNLALQSYDSFSDRRVLDVVFDGLHSDAPAVVEQTLFAVGFYADLVAQRDWPDYADPVYGEKKLRELMDIRTRQLGEVPGLRGFLQSHAERGMNPASCRSLGERDDPEKPSWMLSVAALAVYFPGDAGVRDLVLEMGRCLDTAGADRSILPLLAIGRFRGDAVEDWRVAKLTHPDPVVASWAARGLCWSLTDAGLAALVERLGREDEALAEIVEAVACHGARAVPHLPALRSLENRRHRMSDATFERVASATAKVAQLAPAKRGVQR